MISKLHLVLKHEWYDKIDSGEKTVEYREKNEYWFTRITNWLGKLADSHIVVFHKGYTKTIMKFKVNYVSVKHKHVFAIHLGERIKLKGEN